MSLPREGSAYPFLWGFAASGLEPCWAIRSPILPSAWHWPGAFSACARQGSAGEEIGRRVSGPSQEMMSPWCQAGTCPTARPLGPGARSPAPMGMPSSSAAPASGASCRKISWPNSRKVTPAPCSWRRASLTMLSVYTTPFALSSSRNLSTGMMRSTKSQMILLTAPERCSAPSPDASLYVDRMRCQESPVSGCRQVTGSR
mmetsp:Transcript_38773/g.93096  ORF Transcript_38773/g.93096 Transcript_38773/m.93096 type:complete len:201 (-) Transcript_38773:679-1281(-)